MCIIIPIYMAENVQHYLSLTIFHSLNFEERKPAFICVTRDKNTPSKLNQLWVIHPASSQGAAPTGAAFLGEQTYL